MENEKYTIVAFPYTSNNTSLSEGPKLTRSAINKILQELKYLLTYVAIIKVRCCEDPPIFQTQWPLQLKLPTSHSEIPTSEYKPNAARDTIYIKLQLYYKVSCISTIGIHKVAQIAVCMREQDQHCPHERPPLFCCTSIPTRCVSMTDQVAPLLQRGQEEKGTNSTGSTYCHDITSSSVI